MNDTATKPIIEKQLTRHAELVLAAMITDPHWAIGELGAVIWMQLQRGNRLRLTASQWRRLSSQIDSYLRVERGWSALGLTEGDKRAIVAKFD